MSFLEVAQAMSVLPPTATGDQALLKIDPGTGTQDLNALWGGVRDRWRDKNAYITMRSTGGISLVRFLFAGESGGASASNAITIVDGGREDYLVFPANARLDYNIAAGSLIVWKSSKSG